MKIILIISALFYCSLTNAQNVGVDNPSPSEKLDVNGNINLTGTIKANGVAGTNGQVLMSTGSGLSWGSLMNYKKCVVFNTPGSSTWTVPAGVTEVMVEIWGAGSGGTANCGGTSGGYARTVQYITPGYNMAYTVGSGSTYSAVTTSDGGFSQVTLPLGYVRAGGGGGVSSNQVGVPSSGVGFISNNVFYMFGNSGQANTSTFGMKNATTYVEFKKYGAGGAPVGMFNSTPVEGDVTQLENGVMSYKVASISSVLPSAGGCAGLNSGWSGGPGMIIIWFNN